MDIQDKLKFIARDISRKEEARATFTFESLSRVNVGNMLQRRRVIRGSDATGCNFLACVLIYCDIRRFLKA